MSSKWKVVKLSRYDESNDVNTNPRLFLHELQAIGYSQAMNEVAEQGDFKWKVVEVPDETYWIVELSVKTGKWSVKQSYSSDANFAYTSLGSVVWHGVLAPTEEAATNKCREYVLSKWLRK